MELHFYLFPLEGVSPYQELSPMTTVIRLPEVCHPVDDADTQQFPCQYCGTLHQGLTDSCIAHLPQNHL